MYWCRSVDGSYKELAITDEICTFPLHSALSFQQGAALGIPYLTAYRALVTKARLKTGETVLVHGASGAVRFAIFCVFGVSAAVQAVFKVGLHAFWVFNFVILDVILLCIRKLSISQFNQGSHASWKVLDFFFLKIPGPGKSWKITLSWKVLENILESHAFFYWFK